MNKELDLLQKIREQPGLYLGTKNLMYLHHFYGGYVFKTGEIILDYRYSLHGFDEYVHQYYNDISTNNWAGLIVERSSSQGEAFDKFYDLLDSFLGENAQNP